MIKSSLLFLLKKERVNRKKTLSQKDKRISKLINLLLRRSLINVLILIIFWIREANFIIRKIRIKDAHVTNNKISLICAFFQRESRARARGAKGAAGIDWAERGPPGGFAGPWYDGC